MFFKRVAWVAACLVASNAAPAFTQDIPSELSSLDQQIARDAQAEANLQKAKAQSNIAAATEADQMLKDNANVQAQLRFDQSQVKLRAPVMIFNATVDAGCDIGKNVGEAGKMVCGGWKIGTGLGKTYVALDDGDYLEAGHAALGTGSEIANQLVGSKIAEGFDAKKLKAGLGVGENVAGMGTELRDYGRKEQTDGQAVIGTQMEFAGAMINLSELSGVEHTEALDSATSFAKDVKNIFVAKRKMDEGVEAVSQATEQALETTEASSRTIEQIRDTSLERAAEHDSNAAASQQKADDARRAAEFNDACGLFRTCTAKAPSGPDISADLNDLQKGLQTDNTPSPLLNSAPAEPSTPVTQPPLAAAPVQTRALASMDTQAPAARYVRAPDGSVIDLGDGRYHGGNASAGYEDDSPRPEDVACTNATNTAMSQLHGLYSNNMSEADLDRASPVLDNMVRTVSQACHINIAIPGQ